MSNGIKELAQRVIDLYAQEKSAGDDDLFQTLVELGDCAKDIVELCDGIEDLRETMNGLKASAERLAARVAESPQAPIEGEATLAYQLVAGSGYEAEATYYGVTPERYGHMVGALNGTLKLVTPEIEEQLARLASLDK